MRSIVLMLLMMMLPGMASAWWNDEWPYRVGFTVDTSVLATTPVADSDGVPLLVRLHSANFEDFFLVKEDLSDIRFVAQDDKTPLKFHVESFDLLNQLAFIWVKLPLTQAVGDAPRKYGCTTVIRRRWLRRMRWSFCMRSNLSMAFR